MNIKGNINQEVYIKATIRGITVEETGQVTYCVNTEPREDYIPVKEEDVVFEIPEQLPKKAETPEQPKRRGRPKLATPEGTFEKLEKMRRQIKNGATDEV